MVTTKKRSGKGGMSGEGPKTGMGRGTKTKSGMSGEGPKTGMGRKASKKR